MANKSDLVELKYLSQSVEELNVWGLTNIVDLSIISNLSHGITGILFFDHGYFGQILEGTRSEVKELWYKIKNDPRHRNIELLGITEIKERRFPKWSMKLFDAQEFSKDFPQYLVLNKNMEDPNAQLLRIMKILWQKV